MVDQNVQIAYFSLEIGFSVNVPSYSGGLGILAGDHIKSCADVGIPLCGLTLLYREGYMKQRLTLKGDQTEEYPRFNPESLLTKLPFSFTIQIEGKKLHIIAWQYEWVGINHHRVPMYFLDTDIPENEDDQRLITRRLYHGDDRHRVLQEAVLGFGGVKLLEILGYNQIETYHMNEGHAAFITLALRKKFHNDDEEVRQRCIYTIHTPVPAGHDVFKTSLVKEVIGEEYLPNDLDHYFYNDKLNMSRMALYFCRKANGVSELNGKVVRKMFPRQQAKIGHITNGVHHATWTSAATREVFDKYLPGWRSDPIGLLKEARAIPNFAIWNNHQESKRRLLDYANAHKQVGYDPNILTFAFARRAAAYKRANLLFTDIDRLLEIAQGKIQLIFAGKAHPNDSNGKSIIKDIIEQANKLSGKVLITYLSNYNIWLGRLLTSGVDVWLNTPIRPNEASGTSGMKAAMNGVLNVSILDGWWAEACQDGVNGWAIGENRDSSDEKDADALYTLLEKKVIPTYYDNHEGWVDMMKESIVTSAEFTAQRMVLDYNKRYYHVKEFSNFTRRRSDSDILHRHKPLDY